MEMRGARCGARFGDARCAARRAALYVRAVRTRVLRAPGSAGGFGRTSITIATCGGPSGAGSGSAVLACSTCTIVACESAAHSATSASTASSELERALAPVSQRQEREP
eukprot:1741296-Prymnesium_polylepis.4